MLNVRRESITQELGELKVAGLIHCQRGRITVDNVSGIKNGKDAGSFTALMSWTDPDGKKLLEQTQITTFRKTKTLRMVDLDITLTASTKVTFGDSKDGVLGVRLAAVLQEGKNSGRGITDPGPHTGTIMNAEGQLKEPAVWGKPSNWMDYSGMSRANLETPRTCSRRIPQTWRTHPPR